MSLEDLIINNERLGAGGFGTVFVGQLDERKVAVKRLQRSEKEIDNLVREASKLKRLQYGKHIAYTYGITMKEKNLYMVMEYCEHGDLQNYLKENRESVTYEQKILFCRGILLGLLYCHSMKVFHGDIKCSNVILGNNLEPKLTDFGLSMTMDNIEGYCKTYEGSIYWAAPELFSMEDESDFKKFKDNPYPTDVYSLGATFCQVSFDGTTDFIDSDDIEMDISLGFVSPVPNDAFLEEIVNRCCQFERNERISLDECLSRLDTITEEQLLVPAIDDKWQEMQQDIMANSKLKPPTSFILHRSVKNLVVDPSNLSLLEWLCINNCVDTVKHMIQPHKYDQDQIKWLYEISELCESLEVASFLQSLMPNMKFSCRKLSNLIDNHPQQFFEMLIKVEPNCCSYNLLKKAIERHHNMIVQAVIDSKRHFKNWAIYDAVKFGNTEAVKILANAGAGLEWEDYHTGNTPLITAIDTDNIEIVKILLGFGVDIYSRSTYTRSGMKVEIPYKPLYLAALKGNRKIAKLLVDAGATMNVESSEWHSLSQILKQQGNISMARFIRNNISKKSSLVGNNSLCAALQNKQFDLVQTLISNGENVDKVGLDGYAPLHWAVIVGNEEIVKSLIKAGVDLDIRTLNEAQNFQSTSALGYFSECTPLHIAISEKHLGIVKLLIEAGADFSAKNGLQQAIMDITAEEDRKVLEEIIRECIPINSISIQRAVKSMSPESIKIMIKDRQVDAKFVSECLCIAASNGEINLVKDLLQHGVNINKKNRGKTPLEWTIFGWNIEAMKILINAGADINTKNNRQETPLFQCVWESHVDMIKFLIREGANINATNTRGYKPIRYAKDREVAEILIEAGAAIDVKSDDGIKLLVQYILGAQVDMVQFLVNKGADVNARDTYGYAPIRYANDKEVMKTLINAGANVNAKNQHRETLLIQYVKASDTEVVQLLVDEGADINAKDKYGYTPIHHAKDKEIMKILINAGANVNVENKCGEALLIQYVKASDTEMVQFLVDKGADINAKDKYGNAPIQCANDKKIVKILINAGADINAKNQYGITLLNQYMEASDTEVVQFLVGKGVDISAKDKNGYIPIQHAQSKEVIEILTNTGADINAKNQYRETRLIQCVKESNIEIVQLLVDEGADVNARDKYGNTSIHYAKDKEIMEILINAGANINAKDQYEETCLIQHAQESNAEMVQFLVDEGADINARDTYGYAPIQYAQSKEIMEILINAGANIHAKDQYGETCLIRHVQGSDAEMVQFLIDKGADINAKDKYGYTPIQYAKGKEIMKTLINAGADVNAKNQYGITLLNQYMKASNAEMVQFLLDKGADANAKDDDGNAPIQYANDKKIMKILINAGADINAKNQYGITLLNQYMKASDTVVVQFLVDEGADIHARSEYGKAPIHLANDMKIMEILINAGANINTKNQYRETRLIQCVKASDTEMVQFLADKGADVNAKDKYGNAPIHCAKDKEIMEILINAGANINAKDQYGETCLIRHVQGSDAEMVQFLIDKGADINAKDKNNNAPIQHAQSKEVIKIFINAGADVHAKDQYEKTLLIQYVKASDTEMVQLLVDKGADINTKDQYGYVPIQYANDKEVMKTLINAGADVNAKNQHRETLLIQYVKVSDIEMAQLLVDEGADINTKDKNGYTAIQCANDKEIMKILINAGANVNAKNQYGITLLNQYMKASNAEMVQFLLDKGADANAKDDDGNAPIQYAKSKEIMKILISAGADINVESKYGKTLLVQYVKGSNAEIVQFLIDKGADVNAKDKDGNISIHFVRDTKIAEILTNAGADINAKNRHGKTLFDILIEEQNRNLSNNQYKRKKVFEFLEYLRSL